MEKKNVLLSICIPTYNRGSILHQTLQNIVENKSFDETVEVIISDNCSIDSTPYICNSFVQKYDNIKYFRNEKNCEDENFWNVLNLASGDYVKLQNDYCGFTEEGLEILKEALRKNYKKQIFFTSEGITAYKNIKEVECHDLNDYIKYVSCAVTFISYFGCWKENLKYIKDPFRYVEKKLMQMDWAYTIVSNVNTCVINNQKIFDLSYSPSVRGGYNWFEVHVKNYYEIMNDYIHDGKVSFQTFKNDTKNCLYHFRHYLIYTFVYTPVFYKYDKKGSFAILWKYCGKTPKFYLYTLMFPFLFILRPLFYILFADEKKIYKKLKVFLRKRKEFL